jgi:hypothetical protein
MEGKPLPTLRSESAALEAQVNSVWLGIDDVQSHPWAMRVATSLEDATMLRSNIAQEATHAANREFPKYIWEPIATSRNSTFVVQGTPKGNVAGSKISSKANSILN